MRNRIHSICGRIVIIFIFINISFIGLKAQPLSFIHGKAKGFIGEFIYYKVPADYFSGQDSIVAKCPVDTDGTFVLPIKTLETLGGKIVAGFQQTPFYVDPKTNYLIAIDDSSISKLSSPFNPFLNPPMIHYRPIHPSPKDITKLIIQFDDYFDNYIATKYNHPARWKQKQVFDTLMMGIQKNFPDTSSSFFNNYKKYKIAALEGMTGRKSDKSLAQNYILNQPVLYHHPAYMEFFNQFFDKYLTLKTQRISRHDLEYTINDLASYAALSDSAGKDTLLRNEVIRELVILKNLGQMYHEKEFRQENILKVIRQIFQTSKFKQHVEIARRMLASLPFLERGTKPVTHWLRNNIDEVGKLPDLQGKGVCISFVTTWCEYCTKELQLVPSLISKYGDKVDFVTVICNDDLSGMQAYCRNHKEFTWSFLHYNREISLFDDYLIRSFPLWILLDDKGRILEYNMKSPSEGMEQSLQKAFPKN